MLAHGVSGVRGLGVRNTVQIVLLAAFEMNNILERSLKSIHLIRFRFFLITFDFV